MARAMITDPQALAAMDFIRDFNLDHDQVAFRYTVAHIDKMCAEIGLPAIEGEKEAGKVCRLLTAIHAEKPVIQKPRKAAAKPAIAEDESA